MISKYWCVLAITLVACGEASKPVAAAAVTDVAGDVSAAEVAANACAGEQPCDDGNPCTLNEHCAGGACVGKAKDCDDESPCTQDGCDPVKGCTWLPIAATCVEDGNPCTVNEHCVGAACKSDGKDCDDHNPCTNDSCDPKSGVCGHVSNNQSHCIPRFTLTSPAHGLQLDTVQGQVLVAGTVHSDAGAVAQVTIAGQVTAVAADGSFTALVALQWGPNVLDLTATDANAGHGHAVRGVHWSPQWTPVGAAGALVAAAGKWQWGTQVQTPAVVVATTSIVHARLFGGGPVALEVAQTATNLAATSADLAWSVTATTPGAMPGFGVPLRSACAPSAQLPPITNQTQIHRLWTLDAWNGLLWALWLGGWFDNNASSLLNNTDYAALNIDIQMHALLPPLLADCPVPELRLHVAELRFDLSLQYGGKPLKASIWTSFRAPVAFSLKDGMLRATFGAIEDLRTEVLTNDPDTDSQDAAEKAVRNLVVPNLVKLWQAAGLVELPVALSGSVTVVAGGVVGQ